jgi:hypothetical protein
MTETEILLGRIVTVVFLGSFGVVIARNAYGRRHWVAWHVARFMICCVAALTILILAKEIGLRGWWVQYVAIGLAAPAYHAWHWKRSRWIPLATRRRVIEKWERRTGKVFDSKVYEIDHKIPFAKGGWHTIDNLRVVRRDDNRRKGNNEPTLGDWFHIWTGKDE